MDNGRGQDKGSNHYTRASMKDINLRFLILRASVKAYKNNLNTNKGYKDSLEKKDTAKEKK